MGLKSKTTHTWTCDGCGVEKEGGSTKPSQWNDAWSYVMVDQQAGWDFHGSPWCPRMREKVVLCGKCTERVMDVVNGKPELEGELLAEQVSGDMAQADKNVLKFDNARLREALEQIDDEIASANDPVVSLRIIEDLATNALQPEGE